MNKEWQEMIKMLSYRIEGGDLKILNESKYLMEAFVRPFFGDDELAYDYLQDVLFGASRLKRLREEENDE